MQRNLLIVLAVLLLAGLGAWQWRLRHSGPAVGASQARHLKYQCPMHPQIVRDEPGDCPICHMRLQLVEDGAAAASQMDAGAPGQAPAATPAGGERKIVKWRNPMNPSVFSDHPQKDPMGMDYVPVYADEIGGASDVPGHAAFSLNEQRRQLIGVRSQPARVADVVRTLRLPGRVGEDPGSIQAQALEMDGGVLKAGQPAQVWVTGEQARRARVVSVDRSLDAYSRTFGVRLALQEAPGAGYRPGVYADVRIAIKVAHGVAVPREAVLDTGDRQWVFVQKGDGRFEPRAVQVGAQGDETVEIRQGVAEGEPVVDSSNFLVDSESQFRAAAESYGGAGK